MIPFVSPDGGEIWGLGILDRSPSDLMNNPFYQALQMPTGRILHFSPDIWHATLDLLSQEELWGLGHHLSDFYIPALMREGARHAARQIDMVILSIEDRLTHFSPFVATYVVADTFLPIRGFRNLTHGRISDFSGLDEGHVSFSRPAIEEGGSGRGDATRLMDIDAEPEVKTHTARRIDVKAAPAGQAQAELRKKPRKEMKPSPAMMEAAKKQKEEEEAAKRAAKYKSTASASKSRSTKDTSWIDAEAGQSTRASNWTMQSSTRTSGSTMPTSSRTASRFPPPTSTRGATQLPPPTSTRGATQLPPPTSTRGATQLPPSASTRAATRLPPPSQSQEGRSAGTGLSTRPGASTSPWAGAAGQASSSRAAPSRWSSSKEPKYHKSGQVQ
ncbi:hypothetical protein EJ04DRAFT_523759 [Polyplosphaeria fusca]|uniref:Uncharacterized protein n=1 Tax=Polyplosphaeria fusca TaxID=682080 RepID=A0A9P4R042_9PLEO|nr:hypothetical protein EJ04DRAFT_523759 [Polyplosphaeria fusca]